MSFSPQPILNIRRRSTVGATIDFPTVNSMPLSELMDLANGFIALGFFYYTLSTGLTCYSSTIRAQYAERHPSGHSPTTRGNDVAFAAHGFVMCAITLSMFARRLWGFQQKPKQRPSPAVAGVFVGCVLIVLAVALLVVGWGDDTAATWAWIDVVNTMGWAKLFMTVAKYVPQVLSNYRRQSTVGWSIGQVLLDFVGGVLSVLQLLLDAALQGDWKSFTENPVKLWLGNVSIVFDVVFIVQHYWLYRKASAAEDGAEGAGLLGSRDFEDADR